MVASRTPPATIDLADLDGPLADALRDALAVAARRDQPVNLTDAGRPLAAVTPLRPADPAVAPADPTVAPAEQTEAATGPPAADPWDEESRSGWDEVWAARHAMTEPYVFDPAEHERIVERRNQLREEIAKLDIPPFSAVDWVRDARRDD